MKQFLARKRMLVLSVVAVLAVSAVAIAYFATTGSGGGTGSVTAATADMELTGDASFAELGEKQTIAITAANDTGSPQRVGTVTIDEVNEATGCPDGSFVAGEVVETGNQVPANGSAVVGNVDVTFTNLDAAQNDCIGADTVEFVYSATAN